MSSEQLWNTTMNRDQDDEKGRKEKMRWQLIKYSLYSWVTRSNRKRVHSDEKDMSRT